MLAVPEKAAHEGGGGGRGEASEDTRYPYHFKRMDGLWKRNWIWMATGRGRGGKGKGKGETLELHFPRSHGHN